MKTFIAKHVVTAIALTIMAVTLGVVCSTKSTAPSAVAATPDAKPHIDIVVMGGKESSTWTNIGCLLNSEADYKSPTNITIAVRKSAGWTLSELRGKRISVSGEKTEYKGKAEIVVTEHSQIVVQ